MNMSQKYIASIKREIWEHQGAFIKVPIIVMVILAVVLIVGGIIGSHYAKIAQYDYAFSSYEQIEDGGDARVFEYADKVVGEVNDTWDAVPDDELSLSLDTQREFGGVSRVPFIVFDHLMAIVVFMYLLSCLYDDRKNSSILFWKSLPVSEAQNVFTKVIMATLVVPFIAWCAALIFGVFLLLYAVLGAALSGHEGAVGFVLREQMLMGVAIQYVGTLLATALWLLPLIAWLLLVSAYAKNAVFLHATLPLVGVVMIESIVFGSNGFARLFGCYILNTGPNGSSNMMYDPSWWYLRDILLSAQFWVGLIAAGGMLWGAVYLRENRFEI
ncbi:hypothetical protein [Marinagarivorans algicola]|uniref:hypothetical protein n=1 Tax=Marinagarivorans algicola TaxID=1513270 RepID=UPI0006B8D51C|nr:hypothetical protein [Marinagarivorans algicola]